MANSTNVGEFFISLVIDAANGELTLGNLVTQMGALEVASVGEIAILSKLADSLFEITEATVNTALGIHQVSLATGMSTKELQEWESAATHTKLGAEGLDAAMVHVSQEIWKQQHGRSNDLLELKKNFPGLDISPKSLDTKKPEVIFERLRKIIAASKLDPTDIQNHLRDSGAIYEGMGEILRIRAADFDKWRKERVPITEEELERYNHTHQQFVTIKNLAWDIKNIIASWFDFGISAAYQKLIDVMSYEVNLSKTGLDNGPLIPGGESSGQRATRKAGARQDLFYLLQPDVWKSEFPINETPSSTQPEHTKSVSYAPVIHQTVNIDSKKSPADIARMTKEGVLDAIQIAAANINRPGIVA